MNVKNDLSFVVAHCVNLYEHQSTLNPNLPLRDLFYVADVLQNLVKDKSLYSQRMIKIPNPVFIVFYNGIKEAPERFEMKLSDLFEISTENPALELKVTFLNINQGMNLELMEKCTILKEYVNVLRDFLLKQKAEVIKMSIYEYDEEREMKIIREDERELGREEGLQQGAQRLVKCVENIMESLCVSVEEACRISGVSMKEYTDVKMGTIK